MYAILQKNPFAYSFYFLRNLTWSDEYIPIYRDGYREIDSFLKLKAFLSRSESAVFDFLSFSISKAVTTEQLLCDVLLGVIPRNVLISVTNSLK